MKYKKFEDDKGVYLKAEKKRVKKSRRQDRKRSDNRKEGLEAF